MAKRAPRKSAQDWLKAGFEALASGGVDAVKVERIAKSLGVTKGSFYWHFEGRAQLLAGMLAQWEQLGTLQIIQTVDAHSPDAVARLRLLAELALGEGQHDGIEAGLRSWAAQDAEAAAVVGRVDAARLTYVADLLEMLGIAPHVAAVRSQLFYRVLIGEYMWRHHAGEGLPVGAVPELLKMLLS